MSSKIFNCLLIIVCLVIATQSLFSQTWTTLQGPAKARNERDITVTNDGTTLYVCDKSVLFKSTNSGSSWFATTVEVASPLVTICKPDNPNNVVVGIQNYIQLNVDGGSSGIWQNASTVTGTPLRLSVSPINTQYDQMYLGRQYASGNISLYYSSNAGASWNARTSFTYPTSVYDIAPYPVSGVSRDGHVWAVGSNGTTEGTNQQTVASARGVWRSLDRGLNWEQKNMGDFECRAIAVRDRGASEHPIVVVGTASGKISRTTNSGDNWSAPATLASGVTSVISIRVKTSTNYFYAATNYGVYLSADDGATWTGPIGSATMIDKNVQSFVIVPNSQNTMYATTNTTVYKTIDGGTTWTPIDNNLGRMPLSSVASDGTNSWTVSNQYPEICKFDGSNWTKVTMTDFKGENIIRHPSQTTYVYASGYTGLSTTQKAVLYRSTDAGSSYSSLYSTQVGAVGNILKGVTFDPINNSNVYVYGKDGTTANFYLFPNNGDGTRQPFTVSGTASNTVNDVSAVNVNGTLTIYYALDNAGVYQSISAPSNGNQFTNVLTTVKSIAINPTQPSVVYIAGPTGLRKFNYGAIDLGVVRNDNLKRVLMAPGYPSSTSNVLVLNNAGDKIFYSTNGGTAWIEVQGNLPKPIYDIRSVTGTPSKVYAATENGIYVITGISSAPTLLSPANGDTVGIVPTLTWMTVPEATGYHVQISTDAGFTNIIRNYPTLLSTSLTVTDLLGGTFYWRVAANNFAGEGAFSSSRYFVSQLIGSITLSVTNFLGTDGQVHPRLSWVPVGQTLPYIVYRYSCTYGAGDCNLNGPYPFLASTNGTTYEDYQIIPVSKGELTTTYYYIVRASGKSNKVTRNTADGGIEYKIGDRDGSLPKETALFENYPNPFNPSTTFKYSLAEDLFVSIKVYDVLGREVKILVDQFQEAGYKSITFDASNLPSGVYFYRMTAGTFTDIKKMILLR